MRPNMCSKSMIKFGGLNILVLLLVFAALGPAKSQYADGSRLWRFDYFIGYFGFTSLSSGSRGRGHSWSREPSWLPQWYWRSCKLLRRIVFAISRPHSTSASGALAAGVFSDLFARTRSMLNRGVFFTARSGSDCNPIHGCCQANSRAVAIS